MKKEKKNPIEEKTRNNNFAAAFDYLKRKDKAKFGSQKALAEQMGVNKDTITNIMRCYTAVTEDIITKLQTACDSEFNLQWLRGESTIMLAKDIPVSHVSVGSAVGVSSPTPPDVTAMLDAVTASKDETIAVLRSQLADKDEIISAKNMLINTLQLQLNELRLSAAIEKGASTAGTFLSPKPEQKGQRPTV